MGGDMTARFAFQGQPCERSGRPMRRIGYRGEQILALVKAANERGEMLSYKRIGDQLGMAKDDVCKGVSRLEVRGMVVRIDYELRKWSEPVLRLPA